MAKLGLVWLELRSKQPNAWTWANIATAEQSQRLVQLQTYAASYCHQAEVWSSILVN
jgi:hypothetical protein